MFFFEKGTPTKNIWYYQLNLDRNLENKSTNEKDLENFLFFYKTKKKVKNSWNKDINNINRDTWDLMLVIQIK